MFNRKDRRTKAGGVPSKYSGLYGKFKIGIRVSLIFIVGASCGFYIAQTNFGKQLVRSPFKALKIPRLSQIGNTRTFKFETIKTGLETIELVKFPIRAAGSGGAITVVNNQILFATPLGQLGLLRPGSNGADYDIEYLGISLPMRYAELTKSDLAADKRFGSAFEGPTGKLRVLDLLPVRQADGSLHLYASYLRYAHNCIEFAVSRAPLGEIEGKPVVKTATWEDVFVAEPCIKMRPTGKYYFTGHQSGGRLAQLSENTLLVTVGDFKFDGVNSPNKASIDPNTHLGKAVEINLDTKTSTIFSSGLRNPQGLTVAIDGSIWETEHGPQGGDEVNVLKRSANYGWPEVTYGLSPKGKVIGAVPKPWPLNPVQGRHENYEKPIYAFLPSIGISSMVEVTKDEFQLWKGDLLAASLKNQAIWRLRREGNRIVYAERIPIGQRLRDVLELPDGQLLLLTDAGNLIFIRHKQPPDEKLSRPGEITVSGYDSLDKSVGDTGDSVVADAGESPAHLGEDLFKAQCGGCHAVSNETIVGPPLAGIVGRKVGSIQGYPYSNALARAEGVWTEQRLVDFLSNPQRNFQGTSMPQIVLPFDQYELVVQFLAEGR